MAKKSPKLDAKGYRKFGMRDCLAYAAGDLGCKKKGEKAKPMGFDVTPEMMSMTGGFTVLHLITMAGGMMDAKFTKEDLLELNRKLSGIKAPEK